MSRRQRMVAIGPLALCLLALGLPAGSTAADSPEASDEVAEAPPAFDSGVRRRVVGEIVATLLKRYVYPEAAGTIAGTLKSHLFAGDYIDIETPKAFADQLTEDLVAAGEDQHLRVVYRGDPVEPTRSTESSRNADEYGEEFGLGRLETLEGNVGFLELRRFVPVEAGGDAVREAMAYLSATDAVIIDLCENEGGSATMLPLLASYFFDEEPTHLGSTRWRGRQHPTETWTHATVSGERMADLPLFLLTGAHTFSVAEEFAYSLKHLGRATLVGRTTRGGAHRGGHVDVGYGFSIFVPTGAVVNPVTGTNWERVGVTPDLDVPEEQALETAHREALRVLLDRGRAKDAGALRSVLRKLDAAAGS